MSKYTKAIMAFAGVLLPFLEEIGVPLPPFLTLDWLQGVILAVTPVLVWFFPNKDPEAQPATPRSPAIVGVLALLLASLAISGCSGTAAAYRAADGLAETAYVVGEHYFALVRGVNALDEEGRLSPSELRRLQEVALKTRPIVVSMLNAADAYNNVRSYENEAELSNALAAAAIAISDLIDAIKAVGGSAKLDRCFDAAIETGHDRPVDYCALVAAT